MRFKTNYLLIIIVSSLLILFFVFLGHYTKLLRSGDSILGMFVIGIALNVIAQFIYSIAQKGSQVKKVSVSPSLEARIREIKSYESLESDILSSYRKKEIVRYVCDAFPFLVKIRQRHLKNIKKEAGKNLKRSHSEFMNKPAWSSVASTQSDTGFRFVMGFKNIGCSYWREDPFLLGCFSCGFCSGVYPDVQPTQQELEMQFENALGKALENRVNFDVIEFLNDGSFFNDKEFDPEFRKHLFRKVNLLPYVKRVLVETRPQYVNRDSISAVFDELSKDRHLEIGIGLESADEFIRSVCHRKGFKQRDFLDAIKCISSFNERVGTVVYSMVKPPFLSELETIEDEINTAKFLFKLSNDYKQKIILKLEPAVVAKGTLLDFLFFHGEKTIGLGYSLLSYWSVIEILCRMKKEDIHIPIRIGAREDMDIIEKVPAVYDINGMFNKWDFILYEAVQHFNVHNSLVILLAEIDEALSDKSFDDWKLGLGLDWTSIEECRKLFADEIQRIKNGRDEQSRQAFLMKIFAGLDRIEYRERARHFGRLLFRKQRRQSIDEVKLKVKEFVESEFRQVMKDFWMNVIEVRFEKDKSCLARIYFQIRDLKKKDSLYSIWAGIPTK